MSDPQDDPTSPAEEAAPPGSGDGAAPAPPPPAEARGDAGRSDGKKKKAKGPSAAGTPAPVDRAPGEDDASGKDSAGKKKDRGAAGAAPAADRAPDEDDDGKKKKKKKGKKKKKKKDKMGSSRGIETMFRTTYRTHLDLSALADTKANIMISINGLIMSIIIASIAPKVDTNSYLWLPTSVLLVSCLISIVYAVRAARPRVTKREVTLEDVRADRANILFFGNFTGLGEQDYVTGMTELMDNRDRLYHNMMRDVHGLGSVLARKYELLRVSYFAFLAGIIVSVLAFIAYFGWAAS